MNPIAGHLSRIVCSRGAYLKEHESTIIATTVPPKTTLNPSYAGLEICSSFSQLIKREKGQAYINKIRKTFTQVKNNISLLNAI